MKRIAMLLVLLLGLTLAGQSFADDGGSEFLPPVDPQSESGGGE